MDENDILSTRVVTGRDYRGDIDMREIRGDAKNIRALLGGSKFSIDYYQREYLWSKKQVQELIFEVAPLIKFCQTNSSRIY